MQNARLAPAETSPFSGHSPRARAGLASGRPEVPRVSGSVSVTWTQHVVLRSGASAMFALNPRAGSSVGRHGRIPGTSDGHSQGLEDVPPGHVFPAPGGWQHRPCGGRRSPGLSAARPKRLREDWGWERRPSPAHAQRNTGLITVTDRQLASGAVGGRPCQKQPRGGRSEGAGASERFPRRPCRNRDTLAFVRELLPSGRAPETSRVCSRLGPL